MTEIGSGNYPERSFLHCLGTRVNVSTFVLSFKVPSTPFALVPTTRERNFAVGLFPDTETRCMLAIIASRHVDRKHANPETGKPHSSEISSKLW